MKRIVLPGWIRAGSIALSLWMLVWTCARADEAADQLERAKLLRELLETRPGPQSAPDASSLPGVRIEAQRARALEGVHRQQFEDSQWRKLLGSQQTRIFAPANHAIPESRWRSLTFERESRAEELSADILRRSQEYLSNSRR